MSESTPSLTPVVYARSERKPLTSQYFWRIAKILSILSPLILFLPFVRFSSIAGRNGLMISGFHILIGAHTLDSQLASAKLHPTPMMLWAAGFMVLGIALVIIRSKKASIFALPLSLLTIVTSFLSASMLTWLVKTGSELQFGFYLLLLIEIAIIIITFIAVILKRVHVETSSFKSHMAMFSMLAPGILFLLIFSYLPMPGVLLAFKRYNVFGTNVLENFFKSDWVMFNNFKFLFSTPDALQITRNTVLYNLTFMILGLICSVGLAIAISEIPNRRLAKLYQTTFFLPYFLSWIVVGYLSFALLNFDLGVVNNVLTQFGLERIDWYMRPQYWPFIFIISNIWKYTGYGSIIYIATIAGFDMQIYEASAIDGANRWQQVKYLTIPMLVPMMTLLSILAVGRMFQADLGMFLTLPMGSGALRGVSNVIDLYVFSSIRQGVNVGLPGAAALYQSVVGFILIMTTNYIVRKINPDNALF